MFSLLDSIPRGTRFAATALSIKDCTSSTYSTNASIVLAYGSSAVFNQLILEDNKNRAIFVNDHANLVLVESEVENNRVYGDGGAIYVRSFSNVVIQKTNFRSTLSHCQTATYLCIFEPVYMDLLGNYAANVDGGAMYLDDSNTVVISDSAFLGTLFIVMWFGSPPCHLYLMQ